ncbi:hypothetical protein GCM10011521_04170 [Arenimonas soli]|uniref:Uncharacterized protein n=1 Tax=Arenimonas soli TaxID=2269504 RepID=A0ABQ1HCD7_9GAMM|nr:hypothetical protein [Arenimonas soli]GGA69157.1 hypothetical protein GCM10011521_04170 [Arenimonas soli]
MAGWKSRRLGALEAKNPPNPKMVVLTALEGQEAEVVARYYEETPAELRAGMVVVIKRFG